MVRQSVALIRLGLMTTATCFIASPASSQGVSYRYDALGRLTETCYYNSATQDGRDIDIAYDKSDNRTSYQSNLRGIRLNAGQSMTSPNGVYTLLMQADGNLVLRTASTVLWASNTMSTGSYMRFQGEGNLVVYNSSNVAVWASSGGGYRCARLQVQNDGNMVIVSSDNVPVWATNTAQ